ncbi:MAG: sigma-54-dependent Fis family transcriptional regulator [Acidobacteria bacterium]|nr:sigma-54-dependent Fis family transcriptional regulator [Acidobacteriota bacterium]
MSPASRTVLQRRTLDMSEPTRQRSGHGVFASHAMQRVLRIATEAAPSGIPVLITGESGTGKEVLARIIHDRSGRPRERFIPYNCTGTTCEIVDSQLFGHRRGSFTGASENAPGVIRSADGGTVLLDEIGELDARIQPKLLRMIENQEVHPVGQPRPSKVDVRILAATNADIDQMVRDKRFREDLFYRLNIIWIHIPPLRDHREDIAPLTTHFLRRYAGEQNKREIRMSGAAMGQLIERDWPGNVRQLANEIRRLVAFAKDGTVFTPDDLARSTASSGPPRSQNVAGARSARDKVTISADQPLPAAIEEVERALISRALWAVQGRRRAAAGRLGVSRKGLLLKRRRLNIDALLAGD